MYEIFRNEPGKYTLVDGGLTRMVEAPLSIIFKEIQAMEDDELALGSDDLDQVESIDLIDEE